jgi:hypothetical protein
VVTRLVGNTPYEKVMYNSTYDDNGCRLWLGRTNKGYGAVTVNRQSTGVHRVVWEHHHGPIPKGKEIDHQCENTICVEITHLQLVTKPQNLTLVAVRRWVRS